MAKGFQHSEILGHVLAIYDQRNQAFPIDLGLSRFWSVNRFWSEKRKGRGDTSANTFGVSRSGRILPWRLPVCQDGIFRWMG